MSQKALLLLGVLLFLLSCPLVETKDTFCRNRFSTREDWIYCTKYGTSTSSRVRVKLRAKFLARHSGTSPLQVGIYKDQDFETIINLNQKMGCAERRQMATELVWLEVPQDSNWSEYTTIVFHNQNMPRIYFFVVMDCEHNTHMSHKMMPKIEVDFNIVTQLGEGDQVDHFSFEDQGSLGLHLLLLLIFTPLFFLAIYTCVQKQKQYEESHSPFFIIILALFFQLANLFWKVIHLLMYSSNGQGIPFFDIVSLISQMMSEITFSSLLMMIAYGWTINFKELDIDNNLDIYLPIGAVVIVIHLTLAAMTYVDVDAYHKYHDYAGVQGWVLIFLKLGLFGYYYYCILQNRDKIPSRAKGFYKTFVNFGIIYMLSVPLTIFASFLFPPYQRQFVYTLTTNLVQLISITLMIYQQSSTRSGYFKASLNSLGILPTGKVA